MYKKFVFIFFLFLSIISFGNPKKDSNDTQYQFHKALMKICTHHITDKFLSKHRKKPVIHIWIANPTPFTLVY